MHYLWYKLTSEVYSQQSSLLWPPGIAPFNARIVGNGIWYKITLQRCLVLVLVQLCVSISYHYLKRLIWRVQCGLTVQEGNFQVQDELAHMFARNLNFSNSRDNQQELSQPQAAPQTYSISQHYNDSAHIIYHILQEEESRKLTSATASTSLSASEVLIQHHIDPKRLMNSQLTLFEQAAPDQRSRLIELWRISPPDYSDFAAHGLSREYQETTLGEEERMAQSRYNRKNANQNMAPFETRKDPEGNEGRFAVTYGEDHQNVEPYITSGYEMLAQRDYERQENIGSRAAEISMPILSTGYIKATDPAYGGREWWDVFPGQQPMEQQYGMFDQINNFRTKQQSAVGEHGSEDEEML